MQAIVYDEFGAMPELGDVPPPTPPDRGVVVDGRATGLCRSDWHGWKGHDDLIDPPHVPGHELAGVVAEVGADVDLWSHGDRVTVPFVGGCGRCAQCAAGPPAGVSESVPAWVYGVGLLRRTGRHRLR